MSKAANQYIPGVCNIGPAEIAKRRQLGLSGAVVTIVLVAICVIFNLPTVIRLFVFFPAVLGGTGFLQAYLHFCAGLVIKGCLTLAMR